MLVHYLNSRSLFPLRSRTSQWELKASCGGMPQRMMALRKAFLWRALNPRTWRTRRGHLSSGQFCELDGTAKSVLATQRRMYHQGVIHTSILPPTRASRGGRGLSFSFFSCRRECLRPPTTSTKRNFRDQGVCERVWLYCTLLTLR